MVQGTRARLKSDDIPPALEICLRMPLIKIDAACDENIYRPRWFIDTRLHQRNWIRIFICESRSPCVCRYLRQPREIDANSSGFMMDGNTLVTREGTRLTRLRI